MPAFPAVVASVVRETGWAPLGVLLVHWGAAKLFGHEPYVDPVMHLLGGAAVGYMLHCLCSKSGRWLGTPSLLGLDLLAFGLTSVVALLWELLEFSSDVFLGSRSHSSVANILGDLCLGALGAFLYLGLRRRLAHGASRNRK